MTSAISGGKGVMGGQYQATTTNPLPASSSSSIIASQLPINPLPASIHPLTQNSSSGVRGAMGGLFQASHVTTNPLPFSSSSNLVPAALPKITKPVASIHHAPRGVMGGQLQEPEKKKQPQRGMIIKD